MARPFSLYHRSTISKCCLVLNHSVLVRTIQVLLMAFPTSFPLPPSTASSPGFVPREVWSCLLHGALCWACDFVVGKQSEREVRAPVLWQRDFVTSWEMENRLGQSNAGENRALWEQSGLFCMAAGGYVRVLPSVPVMESRASMGALQIFSWPLWSPLDVLKILPAMEICQTDFLFLLWLTPAL